MEKEIPKLECIYNQDLVNDVYRCIRTPACEEKFKEIIQNLNKTNDNPEKSLRYAKKVLNQLSRKNIIHDKTKLDWEYSKEKDHKLLTSGKKFEESFNFMSLSRIDKLANEILTKLNEVIKKNNVKKHQDSLDFSFPKAKKGIFSFLKK